ncbi:undecaprenyl-phosphate glucose phosphotransferase [Beijerinckia sp. L45]|uniref:undecaprenyl-phosphate glucose phosphotransferase n=1 Tax=Beijerinckia sp. L45 TaxID=1641855 RepID=UPI00131E7E9D|nr:undecaprenyl-phosphate glucose phosphotransferase [Beijerinckia sp. L45]
MAAFSAQDLRAIDLAARAGEAERAVNPHARELDALAEAMAQHKGRRIISAVILEGLVRLFEFFLILATGIATYFMVVVPVLGFAVLPLLGAPLLAALIMLVLQALGVFRVSVLRLPSRFGWRIALAWIGIFALAYGVCYAAQVDRVFLNGWLVHWGFAGFVALVVERTALFFTTDHLARTGRLSRRTVIVGGGEAAHKLLEDFSEQGSDDLHIFGIFDDRTDARSPDVVAGFPKLGNVDDLVDFARHTPLDLVIFTLPISAEQRLLVMLRKLWVLPVDIRLAAHMNKLRFRPRAYSYIGSVPVIDLFDKPIADWDVVVKTIFDKVVGLFCLLMLSPVMLLVALAVKLDSKGPALFRQKRYGFNNELIEVFKFRSMYTEQLDATAAKLVTRGDPRVTRVGRFIRKTSLDELPQLFNVVFKGNLSLVGPRPHAVHAKADDRLYDEVVDSYFARHRVRPGITGWAQINGWRGETDTPEKIQKRVECDLYYIENWSIFLDIYVLFATPVALLTAKNAY